MRTILIAAVSAATCAFLGAPAFAQDTVTGAPAGEAPVTVEGYGYGPGQPGQPGIGNDYPAGYGYGYAYPQPWAGAGVFAPIGALAWGLNAAGGIVTAPFGAPYYGAPAVAPAPAAVVARTAPGCQVWADWNGRRTAMCGP